MKPMQKLREIKESVKEAVRKISESAWLEAVTNASKAGLKTASNAASATKHVILGAVDAVKLVVHVAEAGANTTIGLVKAAEYAGKKCMGNEEAGEAGEAAIERFRNAGKNVYQAGEDTFEFGKEAFGAATDTGTVLYQFGNMTVESFKATKELCIAARDGELRTASLKI